MCTQGPLGLAGVALGSALLQVQFALPGPSLGACAELLVTRAPWSCNGARHCWTEAMLVVGRVQEERVVVVVPVSWFKLLGSDVPMCEGSVPGDRDW